MAKFKVLKVFRDIETKETYAIDQEIELTAKRAKEVVENLDDSFFEKIEVAKEKKADVCDEEVEPANTKANKNK